MQRRRLMRSIDGTLRPARSNTIRRPPALTGACGAFALAVMQRCGPLPASSGICVRLRTDLLTKAK
jgi:hypothetical protein